MTMNVILTIIARTPIWVWPLIAGVLWLGSLNLRQRTVPLRLALVFPVVMLALSVGNATGTAAPPPLALASWFIAVALGASGLRGKVDRDRNPPLIQTVRGAGYTLRAPN